MVKVPTPVLVTVTDLGAPVVATTCLPESRLLGFGLATGFTPCPVNGTWLPPMKLLLELIVSNALCVRATVGLNLTETEQPAPGLSVAPEPVLLGIVKPPGPKSPRVTLEICTSLGC
ncbi:MAG: hypothetical protein M3157_04575 [Actinomycetota bacterium]|nr:hypothetical protein [Actinomycetota bacterium]